MVGYSELMYSVKELSAARYDRDISTIVRAWYDHITYW